MSEGNSSVNTFCGSPFWDLNVTWFTDDPDFTKCFEKTALIWMPCVFLWLFAGLEVYYILHSKKRDIPWNILNVTKLIATGALILLCIVDFVMAMRTSRDEDVYLVDVYGPGIKMITFLLSATLLVYNRKFGQSTSGLQFLFWLLLAVCGAFQLRTEVREHAKMAATLNGGLSYYFYVSYTIYYTLVLAMFVLNCFADQKAHTYDYPLQKNPLPEEHASFLSRLMFSWFDTMAWRGFKKPLVEADLWDMKYDDMAVGVVPIFEKHWLKTLEKSERTIPIRQTSAQFRVNATNSADGHVDFHDNPTRKTASITPALIKSFGGTFVFGAILKLIQDLLSFVSPQVLSLLIGFVKENDYQWKGFLYVALLFVTAGLQTVILSQYFHRMYIVGMRIRTALVSAVYKKALRVSNRARKETTVGEIVNLMSVDAQKFIELTAYLNMIWSAPLQIILALVFLWRILGPSVLSGLAVMIVLIPINAWIANKVKLLQVRQMRNKDQRVKLMNEILSGIKVLKLYAWEPSFEQQVLNIRAKEVQVLKETSYLSAGTAFIWSCAPFLVSLVSFATYVLVDESHVLDASKAFVSVSLFNILRFPLSMLPMLISNMVQASVSINRLNKFMNAEDLNPENVNHDANKGAPLVIEGGTFTWDTAEEPTLKNINVRFTSGSLTAIVGAVGSGKSSLISAFLGEMDKIKGAVNTLGSVAYVAQQAWIQNASLRANILFGKSYNRVAYERAIDACALRDDLEILTAGDQTEIGEKGINLSGGQKQRVSLARAVYANCDVYFLDDPLSAVDSNVGKHIFEKVIGPNGLLRHKTRVLVTHGITYLPQTDSIVVLKDGVISESGTYQELLDRKGAFSEFLLHHVTEAADEADEEELNMLKDQLSGTAMSEEISKKLAQTKSHLSESGSESGSLRRSVSLQRDHCSNESLQRQDSKRKHNSLSVPPPGVDDERLIEVEKAETGSVKWTVYKYYLKSIGVVLSVATVLLVMVFQAFSVGSNMWLGLWSADTSIVVNGTVDTSKRDFYLGIYGALGLGQAISILLSALTLYIGALNGARILHNLLLWNLLRAPATTFYDVTPVGRILNRFSKDIDTLDNVLPMTIRGWITCFFSVLGTLVVISYTTPIFVAVIVPIGILYYLIQRFYVATSRQLKRLESVSRSPIYSHFSETVTGASAIRAFGEQKRFIQESERRVDTNQVCYYPSIISNRWLAVRLEMIGNLIILFAALFAVLGKDHNPGLVGLSVTYALQITQTLNWLVRMTSEVETNIVAVERIKEYGEVPQEAAWDVPNKKPSADWPQTGTVEFRNYSVRYRPGLDMVLKRVNFCINGGEKIGIVGRTGAGKSSLTLSLFRIIEASEGNIFIDDVNISELGLHTLRSRITIIPQDAVLFSGTLRMNLDPFDEHSDEEVWKSLENAHLKAYVAALSTGLQHEVSEGGENLSVGQRQLICLGRALLRKTKLLILDEATAAVDLETDDLIQRTIKMEFHDCTVLTIAHRLNTIMDSDRVIVLDKGRIVEFNTPTVLLQQKGIFHNMCKDAGLA